ncbi:MAG TPA: MarR family winged helix-turn-helix transcriptional regulator [Cellulomonas sp.]|nr:MarR family winged helix-turn-helix transcriptional regulator [Cellulomonas sp.]
MSTGYLLSKVGQAITADFADRIAATGLRPRHVGLLAAIAADRSASQRELGVAVGVGPSAVVPIVDDLESLGAVVRRVDPANRRRHVVELTPRGGELLEAALAAARAQDDELLSDLPAAQRAALHDALVAISRSTA